MDALYCDSSWGNKANDENGSYFDYYMHSKHHNSSNHHTLHQTRHHTRQENGTPFWNPSSMSHSFCKHLHADKRCDLWPLFRSCNPALHQEPQRDLLAAETWNWPCATCFHNAHCMLCWEEETQCGKRKQPFRPAWSNSSDHFHPPPSVCYGRNCWYLCWCC